MVWTMVARTADQEVAEQLGADDPDLFPVRELAGEREGAGHGGGDVLPHADLRWAAHRVDQCDAIETGHSTRADHRGSRRQKGWWFAGPVQCRSLDHRDRPRPMIDGQ